MIRNVLLDAGPLAAMTNSRDALHLWTRSQIATIVPPLQTCESVISEACFLSRRSHGGVDGILGLIELGIITVDFEFSKHIAEVVELMKRFSSVPMSLADACLVRMSELSPESRVLTFDADFLIYRRNRRQKIPLMIPEDHERK